MARASSPPEVCPVCGDAVPRAAKACPGCGADERTGWDEATLVYDELDLPGENFDREKFHEQEFGLPRKKSTKEIILLVAALLTLAAMTFFYVFRH